MFIEWWVEFEVMKRVRRRGEFLVVLVFRNKKG